MFAADDTIVAIATPPGRGGIGVIRISGPEAHRVAVRLTGHPQSFKPRYATLTSVRASIETAEMLETDTRTSRGASIDQTLVTYFPGPHSYTGEDVAEISAHGSPVILERILKSAIVAGARLAEPGEFTLRSYLNGRIDLPQAEAVGDLIDAVTPLQARVAFDQLQGTLTAAIGEIDAELFDLIARLEASVDFPDEGYHFVSRDLLRVKIAEIRDRVNALLSRAVGGRLLREGLTIAIVGPPNVGKSSLFNALVGASRAIVTSVPGTTRDLVTETIDFGGLKVTLVDTAGLRVTDDLVEAEGVARTRKVAAIADVVLSINVWNPPDRLAPQAVDNKRVMVLNKADLVPQPRPQIAGVWVSAISGEGLESLRQEVFRVLDVEPLSEQPSVTNVRHIALLDRVQTALSRAVQGVTDQALLSEEFVLADLQDARDALEEIVGRRTPDDVLSHIFERFCIGK